MYDTGNPKLVLVTTSMDRLGREKEGDQRERTQDTPMAA